MLSALVLSKEETVIRVISRVFKDLGVEVEQFVDQKLALRKVSAKKFDAIVADDEIDCAIQLLESARDLPLCRKSVRILLAGGAAATGSSFQGATQIVLYKPLSAERVRHGLRAVRNLMAQERRSFKRVRVEMQARLSFGKVTNRQVAIEDLSDSGAAIHSDNPLPASAQLTFECTLPDFNETIKAKGEIVWQDPHGGVGIRFLDMPAHSRKRLVEWLALESSMTSNDLATSGLAAPAKAAR